MEITVRVEPPVVIAAVHGRFDVHGVDTFAETVTARLAAPTTHAIIDLADVEFMDSSALAALVRALKRAVDVGGSIVLARVSHTARIILELTRLELIFEQAESVDAARALLVPAHAS